MRRLTRYFKISAIVFLGLMAFFSCEGTYDQVQLLNLSDDQPIAEGEQVNLKYTDSGLLVTNLITPKLLDYSNFEFAFQEFPEGLNIHFFDRDKESTVRSDYAIRYSNTGLVDLRDNVVLTTADGNVLEAQQLYWDQSAKWLFTDQPYRITFSDGSYNDGSRFDANEDFTIFLSRNNQGIQRIVDPE
ncbi:MAG: LPS export ABC transporter periplasmic protein LptC [Flavobacteriaceae bacterium]